MKQSARVLVADDDHDTADTTADLLQLEGYETRAVYNGRQAVDSARIFDPDVAILDINTRQQLPCARGVSASPHWS